MKHRKKRIAVLLLVCTFALAGCGSSHTGGEDPSRTSQNESTDTSGMERNASSQISRNENTDTSGIGSGDELLDNAILKGTVSDFQEGSFQVVPTQDRDHGQTAVEAAPGMESGMESTTVSYGADCTFQIAVFNSETGDVRFEDAAASQVKKSTGVAVYGETQENGEIRATKVYITRYE